jgi:hypothetical protein
MKPSILRLDEILDDRAFQIAVDQTIEFDDIQIRPTQELIPLHKGLLDVIIGFQSQFEMDRE